LTRGSAGNSSPRTAPNCRSRESPRCDGPTWRQNLRAMKVQHRSRASISKQAGELAIYIIYIYIYNRISATEHPKHYHLLHSTYFAGFTSSKTNIREHCYFGVLVILRASRTWKQCYLDTLVTLPASCARKHCYSIHFTYFADFARRKTLLIIALLGLTILPRFVLVLCADSLRGLCVLVSAFATCVDYLCWLSGRTRTHALYSLSVLAMYWNSVLAPYMESLCCLSVWLPMLALCIHTFDWISLLVLWVLDWYPMLIICIVVFLLTLSVFVFAISVDHRCDYQQIPSKYVKINAHDKK